MTAGLSVLDQSFNPPLMFNAVFYATCPECGQNANIGSVRSGNLVITCPTCDKGKVHDDIQYKDFIKQLVRRLANSQDNMHS